MKAEGCSNSQLEEIKRGNCLLLPQCTVMPVTTALSLIIPPQFAIECLRRSNQ